jgi:hypothetical protein
MSPLASAWVLAAALAVLPNGIVMRHDVDPAEYVALAEQAGTSFVRLSAGCGTFIHPKWILTAAHVAESPRVGESVTVRGVEYPIIRRIIHPGYSLEGGVLKDIALLELAADVPGVEPALLYEATDEVGKDILFVGTGWAGTGDRGMADGAINRDRQLRAAQNRVDGTKPDYLRFTFDAPDSGAALPLEGISGPGDSGGPALWIDGGRIYILGVSSHQDGRGLSPEGVYGVFEYYTRVSEFRAWILEHVGDE